MNTKPTSFSLPNLQLRLEGAALFIAALIVYGATSGDWLAFVLLLLMPDLSAVGYAINLRVGSITYNLAHTYLLPILLLLAAWLFAAPVLLSLALIWIAHISMDRAIGYGLKYPSAFKDTHLQRV